MTECLGDYTLHNIWSTLCTVEVIELEILHPTRLPYLVWTVVSPFCVPVPFRSAFFGSNTYIQLFDQRYL